jgi:nucleoside 2-deoxyribosyltransferase
MRTRNSKKTVTFILTKPTLYLAHPGPDRHWVREVELELEKDLGIDLINPFYDIENRPEIKKIDKGKMSLYDKRLHAKKIVEGDLNAIVRSDGVLAFLTESLVLGTSMEIFWCAYILRKPVYLIITRKEWWYHPWLEYLGTKKFISDAAFKRWWRKTHEGK